MSENTTQQQAQEAETDLRWRIKGERGEVFGPVDLETLKTWAREGRLAPTHQVSDGDTGWKPVTYLEALEMEWVTEVSPGSFFGPIHQLALESFTRKDYP